MIVSPFVAGAVFGIVAGAFLALIVGMIINAMNESKYHKMMDYLDRLKAIKKLHRLGIDRAIFPQKEREDVKEWCKSVKRNSQTEVADEILRLFGEVNDR